MSAPEGPRDRVRAANDAPVRAAGDYVLYWSIAARRTRYHFGLERAGAWARHLRKPLLVFEPLRAGYRWASSRPHAFVIQGMAANAAAYEELPATYYPYLEPEPGAGKGLLRALARRACLVVTDEFPCFFLPRMVAAAAEQLPVLLEVVDANGLLPLAASDRAFPTAYSFRRFLQRTLPESLLEDWPKPDPLRNLALPRLGGLPDLARGAWGPATRAQLADPVAAADALPIDNAVRPAPLPGGQDAARARVEDFVRARLSRYGGERNHPDEDAASGLSPYLHFGHVAAQEVFEAVADDQGWRPEDLGEQRAGKRQGFWGMGESAESFLDELVTWRELGYHFCRHRPDYAEYESLPEWARTTLAEHAGDRRDPCYSRQDFEEAATHDPVWNAAQRQLREEGIIHNYLRMLWGKKILHWSESPREALEIMEELNNRWALDGRDPNSYSGISWVLGRFDRAWGPERPVFGKIRYMTSASTKRKLELGDYLERWGGGEGEAQLPL